MSFLGSLKDRIAMWLTNEENCNLDQGPMEQNCPCPSSSGNLPERVLSVHRSCIRTELIEHFKDPSVMDCIIDFKLIHGKGQFEQGVGVGVICEVYTLFWSEFSISMTIGEICYCLFGNQVPDSMFVDSFTKYLSPVEEEFIVDIIRKNQLPDDEDEFTDFLERFKRRRVKTSAKSFLKFPSWN